MVVVQRREEGMDPERKTDGNTLFCCSAFSLLLEKDSGRKCLDLPKKRAHMPPGIHLITGCTLEILTDVQLKGHNIHTNTVDTITTFSGNTG